MHDGEDPGGKVVGTTGWWRWGGAAGEGGNVRVREVWGRWCGGGDFWWGWFSRSLSGREGSGAWVSRRIHEKEGELG